MQKAKIKTIEKYLTLLPDSSLDLVISFVSYLNFMKDIESDYPYPDEKASIEQYCRDKGKTFSWNEIKDN